MSTYERQEDGSWVPATPMGWVEEHNWFQTFILWVMGKHHCNDKWGQKRSRFRCSGPKVK